LQAFFLVALAAAVIDPVAHADEVVLLVEILSVLGERFHEQSAPIGIHRGGAPLVHVDGLAHPPPARPRSEADLVVSRVEQDAVAGLSGGDKVACRVEHGDFRLAARFAEGRHEKRALAERHQHRVARELFVNGGSQPVFAGGRISRRRREPRARDARRLRLGYDFHPRQPLVDGGGSGRRHGHYREQCENEERAT
jgi:hypothetical protein